MNWQSLTDDIIVADFGNEMFRMIIYSVQELGN